MSTTADLNLNTLIDAIANAVADRLSTATDRQASQPAATPWLNAEQAAAYLGGAPVSRVHDLTQQRKLVPHRDGRRLLFHRDDLDAYLRGGK
jgi:excisionase family DNA binding protein